MTSVVTCPGVFRGEAGEASSAAEVDEASLALSAALSLPEKSGIELCAAELVRHRGAFAAKAFADRNGWGAIEILTPIDARLRPRLRVGFA